MFVEEILYNNIKDEDHKKDLMEITLTVLDPLKRFSYSESNLKYIKGSDDMWLNLNREIYNLPLNYNMDYQLPCNDLAHIINNTLIEIKEIVNKKRNKIAIEYLFGYRQDKKVCLLKDSEGNEFLKKLLYD